jgi:hypothetical protein
MKRTALTVASALTALLGLVGQLAARDLAVLHPVERPAFSQDWRESTTRNGHPGDWQFVILRTGPNGCAPIHTEGPDVTFWQMLPLTTRTPSGEDTVTGVFHEALAPRSAATCAMSSLVLAEWPAVSEGVILFRQAEREVLVRQKLRTRPAGPSLPFFVGLNPANLPRGHCFRDDCFDQAVLLDSYAALLKAHRIQPMQTFVRFPPIRKGRLDLDHREAGASFRDTIMRHAIHGMVGFPRATRYIHPVTYLKALQRTVEAEDLKGRAWVYAADEPSDIDALAAHLRLYRQHAPDVRVMVTTERDARLEGLVDIHAPVFNRLSSGRHSDFHDYRETGLWTYLSCMGSCGPHRAERPDAIEHPGPETGIADLLIDRPAAKLLEFFRSVSGRVDGLLYYEATETYRLAPMGTDIFGDTWNFGGNGDGLLVFPGRPGEFGLKEHTALPSLRLKLLRHALQNARARVQR